MSEWIAVRIASDVARSLDELVRTGRFETRADAVRNALEALVDHERRRTIGERIVEGYGRIPQEESEFPELDEAGVRSIGDEPW
jgi:Arc/MetJ-type ribon-helix-helix transcriptional regulator